MNYFLYYFNFSSLITYIILGDIMNNYKIVIDSGHGGVDSGAVGNGIVEKDLTLKISKYIYDRLNELGIPVVMTRLEDETVNPDERVRRILNAYGDNSDVIVVSNHINAGGGDGAEVIYALRNNDNLANIILKNIEAAGQNVRKVYQRRLPSNPSKDYYFIHRNTGKTQPVIVEYGFLDSKQDDIYQLKNNYQTLAEAVVKSLAEYTNTPYMIENIDTDNYYTVKSGDSLWSVAKRYGLTVDELKRMNNLNSNNLRIGQVLLVKDSEEQPNEFIYIVKPKDSLYSIARNFNTTVSELKRMNDLTSDILSVGQELIIKEPLLEEVNSVEYVVKKGDNLYSISKAYNVSQQDIMKLNNLKSNLLSIGQILKIPTDNIESIYVVKSGDTLYKIARDYNKTVSEIKAKNNLISDILSVGQELII